MTRTDNYEYAVNGGSAGPDYFRAGVRALRILDESTIVPRHPQNRAELYRARNMLASLVEGYRETAPLETREA